MWTLTYLCWLGCLLYLSTALLYIALNETVRQLSTVLGKHEASFIGGCTVKVYKRVKTLALLHLPALFTQSGDNFRTPFSAGVHFKGQLYPRRNSRSLAERWLYWLRKELVSFGLPKGGQAVSCTCMLRTIGGMFT